MAESFGGRQVHFAETIHERFKCNVCYQVLQNPYLMVCCGEKFCLSCLKCWFKTNHSLTCLYCRTKLKPSLHKWCVPERGMKREIWSFKVFCIFKKNGCAWTGELRHLSNHTNTNLSSKGCVYKKVRCPNQCKTFGEDQVTSLLLKDLKAHLNTDCQMASVNCQYCHFVGLRKEHARHTEICENFPISCSNVDCGESLVRRNMEDHLKCCQLAIVTCMNREVGCEIELRRQDMEGHESCECKFRQVECQHCKEVGMFKDQAGHHDVCSFFPVACPNSCGEVKIARRSLQSHRSQCLLESVECSLGCKSVVSRKELAKHETTRCELRKVNCRHCEKTIVADDLQEHNRVCDLVPVSCPNECGKEIIRKSLADHRRECQLESLPCRYNHVGCEEMIQRKFWRKHMKENLRTHLEMAKAFIRSQRPQSKIALMISIEEKAKVLKEKLDHINEEVEFLKTKM